VCGAGPAAEKAHQRGNGKAKLPKLLPTLLKMDQSAFAAIAATKISNSLF
jgi:hypothetical protein